MVHRIRKLRVYGLVGKSGTGKSFRSQLLLEKYHIDILIDDGLIIKNQRIIAGRSAKKEETYLSAVRVALFEHGAHQKEAIHCLKSHKWRNLLVLGTSVRMIEKICAQLKIPQPRTLIDIEHIASRDEIASALKHRTTQGVHMIPIPSIEVRRRHPRLNMDSMRLFFQKKVLRFWKKKTAYEKTIVRPTFSSGHSLSISETALSQMLMHCAQEFDASININRVSLQPEEEGYLVDLYLNTPYQHANSSSMYHLRQYMITHIQQHSQISLKSINIIVHSIK